MIGLDQTHDQKSLLHIDVIAMTQFPGVFPRASVGCAVAKARVAREIWDQESIEPRHMNDELLPWRVCGRVCGSEAPNQLPTTATTCHVAGSGKKEVPLSQSYTS